MKIWGRKQQSVDGHVTLWSCLSEVEYLRVTCSWPSRDGEMDDIRLTDTFG